MATLPTAKLTEEEYLRIERLAETKSEYHDGQMFAMAGGTVNHSILAQAIGALLFAKVPPGCRVFNSDMRVKVSAAGLYTYPDCAVICGNAELVTDQKDCLVNPLLIAEVLSPSTEGYDRGKKFEMYRMIESLREYLVIAQDRRYVEHWSKHDDGSWTLRDYSEEAAVVPIPRLNSTIPFAELYASAMDLA